MSLEPRCRDGAARLFVAAAGLVAIVTAASAADWSPTRAIRIVVPFAPGEQPDVVARALAEPLSTPAEVTALMRGEGARWAAAIKAAGIAVEN